jgi:predicted Rossmann fold flavoprotein
MTKQLDIAIIGGGASGFFAALNIPLGHRVSILEESPNFLRKVKISGGGRCNITHHEFDVRNFIKNYPRGQKELISPFHQFQAQDTVEWFEKRGVKIIAENDGRMFPSTNSSQTIIDCFLKEAKKNNIQLQQRKIINIKKEDEKFHLTFANDTVQTFDRILMATGSSKSGYELAKKLGHTITPLAPSLFSFKIKHPLLKDMAGTSFKNIYLTVEVDHKKFKERGDLLITHWGLSGPAILKISAWAAREFKQANYKAKLTIDFGYEDLHSFKKTHTKNLLKNAKPQIFTQKFWLKILNYLNIKSDKNWADINKKELDQLDNVCQRLELDILGQNRFKDEFVECGGIELKEVNFKTMESKLVSGLYFAGEILDIDGITGGFNFQNAWTSGYIVGHNIAKI